MRNPMRAMGVTVVMACGALGGCGSYRSSMHMDEQGPHGPQCPAIQSAMDASFSSDRARVLQKIAASPGLSEHEQIFLIDATLEPSGFSSDRTEVLVTLARNPATTPGARDHMARRVRKSSLFSSDRARIADALAEAAGARARN